MKANEILNDIVHKAYVTPTLPTQFKTDKQRIDRSISDHDINRVDKIWNQLIVEHKDKISNLLASKIETESDIYIIFMQNDIVI